MGYDRFDCIQLFGSIRREARTFEIMTDKCKSRENEPRDLEYPRYEGRTMRCTAVGIANDVLLACGSTNESGCRTCVGLRRAHVSHHLSKENQELRRATDVIVSPTVSYTSHVRTREENGICPMALKYFIFSQ
jgi:hypothetical protein